MAAHQPIRRRNILLADNETTIGEPMSCRGERTFDSAGSPPHVATPLTEAGRGGHITGCEAMARVENAAPQKSRAAHRTFRPHWRPCETKTARRSSRQHLRRGVKSFPGFAHDVSFTRFNAGPLIKLKRPAAQTYFFPGSCFPASSEGVTWSSS